MVKSKKNIVVTDETEFLLKKGFKEAKDAAKEKSSVENLKNLTEAERLLDAHRAKKAAPGAKPFKAISDVLAYLQAEGWQVQKSKLYADARKIPKEKDGSFTKKAVDEYAATCLEKRDGSNKDISDVAQRKALAEAESAEHDAARKKRIEDCANGKLILKTEVEQKHTAKLAHFKTAVENLIYGGPLEEVVEMLNGDIKKLPPAQKHLMRQFLLILAEYAKSSRFTIPKKSMLEALEEIEAIRNAE